MHYSSKIALRREKLGESAPFWRFSAASYPDLKEATLVDALSEVARQAPDTGSSDFSVEVPSLIVFFFAHISCETSKFMLFRSVATSTSHLFCLFVRNPFMFAIYMSLLLFLLKINNMRLIPQYELLGTALLEDTIIVFSI